MESDKSKVIKRMVGDKRGATNIIVKDYLYHNNFVFGHFYQISDGVVSYILDDGDIFTLIELDDMGCVYIKVNSNDIIEKFENMF